MIIRSKAPLRLGLAGGGTDVSPYSDIYGGYILNATINHYAYASIKPRTDGKIIIRSIDKEQLVEFDSAKELEINGDLDLLKGVYNRIIDQYKLEPLSFELSTFVDAPPGSGLGTSSTLCTAILGAFVEWLSLPLGDYEIARLAYEIERHDLLMAGGKQDQYAATFGGVNFMEFYDEDKVIVNPLRVQQQYLSELSHNLVLCWTGKSRLSGKIIEEQQKNVASKKQTSIESMHHIKEHALLMKEAFLKGELGKIGEILDTAWEYKKQMAASIVTDQLESFYHMAKKAGATGGKISGAGGGGFMFFYCPDDVRYDVAKVLTENGGVVRRFEFTNEGLMTWRYKNN